MELGGGGREVLCVISVGCLRSQMYIDIIDT